MNVCTFPVTKQSHKYHMGVVVVHLNWYSKGSLPADLLVRRASKREHFMPGHGIDERTSV
jgi:hypothetical protein